MENNEREFIVLVSIIALAVLAFFFALFGLVGIKVVIGIITVSFPFYLISSNFKLDQGEKFIFSLLLGLAIFPSLVYILGFLISFKMAIFMVFALLIGISFLIKHIKSRNIIS